MSLIWGGDTLIISATPPTSATTLFGHPLFSRYLFNPASPYVPVSDFIYQPEFMAQIQREPRVLLAAFGGLYEQRAADGINNDLRKWNLTFYKSTAIITAIETQLRGYGGLTAFTWTPSGENELTIVCRKWSRTRTAPDAQSLTTVFEEVVG